MTYPPASDPVVRKKHRLEFMGVAAVAGLLLVNIGNVPSTSAQQGEGVPQSVPSTSARPKFEVASVKVNKSGSEGTYLRPTSGGLFVASNASLRAMIATAYLAEFPPKGELIFGGPDWIDSEHFDIEAKAESGVEHPSYGVMLQSLLEDRFKLTVHHETRQLPIYALVPSKAGETGRRLVSHSADAKCTAGKPLPQPGPNEPMPSYCGGFFINPRPGDLRETGNGVTMDAFAQFLGTSVDRKVINRTGLAGIFDFSLEFAPQFGPGSVPGDIAAASDQAGPPSIFTALEEQLGLKLKSQTGPIDVLVIDHAEEPSAN